MLSFQGGALIITDQSGIKRFDTSEGLFTITDFVSSDALGPVTLPERIVSSSEFGAPYTNTDTSHTITTVNANATHVFGMFQTTTAAGSGNLNTEAAPGVWRQATGTHVQAYAFWGRQNSSSASSDKEVMSALVLYTFVLTGGVVKLNERLVMRGYAPFSGSIVTYQKPVTVHFRLWCGLFV